MADTSNPLAFGGKEDAVEEVAVPSSSVESAAGQEASKNPSDGLNSATAASADATKDVTADHPPAASNGSSTGDAGAAPAPPALPPVKPILRGRVFESSSGAGGTSYEWTGKWALSEADQIWSEFRYQFKIAALQPQQLPPTGVLPANPRLPSAQDHAIVGGPMTGHFFMLNPATNKLDRHADGKITLRIGGALPPEAPLPLTTADGQTISSANALVGITGEGSMGALKYNLHGSYHPATGTAWIRKVYTAAPAKPAGGDKRAKSTGGGARPAGASSSDASREKKPTPKPARSLEESALLGPPAGFLALPASRAGASSALAGIQIDAQQCAILGASTANPKDIVRDCEALLASLRRDRDHIGYFLQPVPVEMAPNYHEVIKNPMDVSKVTLRLKGNEYATRDAFAADVRLIFSNAMLFNPPAHPVHQAALKLKNDFDALYQRRLEATLIEEEKRKRAADEEARHAQGGGSSSSSAAAQRSSAALKAGSKAAEVGAKRKATHQQRGGDDSDEGDSSDSDEHGPSAAKKARKSTGGSAAGGGAGKDVSKSGTGSSGSGGAGGASDEVRDLRNQIQQLQSSLVTIMECTKQLAATQAAGQVMAMAPAGGAGAAAALMNPAAFAQIMASAAGLGGGAGGSAPISEPKQKEKKAKPMPAKPAAPKASPSSSAPTAASKRGGSQPASGGGAMAVMIPLSKDEQMALASAVDNLNEGQMEGLLQIVQERVSLDNPSAAASNGGEVELDIESMDTATLRELQRYISQCTGQAMPLQAKIYFANQNKAAAAASATATVAPPAKPAAPVPPAPGGVSIAERNLANLAKLEASSIPGPSASSVPGPSGPAIPDSGFIEGLGDDDEEEADAPPPPPPAM